MDRSSKTYHVLLVSGTTNIDKQQNHRERDTRVKEFKDKQNAFMRVRFYASCQIVKRTVMYVESCCDIPSLSRIIVNATKCQHIWNGVIRTAATPLAMEEKSQVYCNHVLVCGHYQT